MVAKLVYYRGQVQGVGFRWNTALIAEDFPIRGYVQNLGDGSVKLWAEGPERDVNAFLARVRVRFEENITEAEEHEVEEQGYAVFEIKRR